MWYLIDKWYSVPAEGHFLHFTFLRIMASMGLSFVIAMALAPMTIRLLSGMRQPVRTGDNMPNHQEKQGTPTMGGVIFIASIFLTSLLVMDLGNPYVWILLFSLGSFAYIGYLDDIRKIRGKSSEGLSKLEKLALQGIFSILIAVAIIGVKYANLDAMQNLGTFIFQNPEIKVSLPGAHSGILLSPFSYTLFSIFILTSWSNATNITDGLDGLSIFPSVLLALSLAIVAFVVGHTGLSGHLGLSHYQSTQEVAVVACSLVGSGLAFLWYNAKPAHIFMGDTGALALGAFLGTLSLIISQELLLVIMGSIYVYEILTVAIQLTYYKLTKKIFGEGRRVFPYTPIHHYYEKKWGEQKLVVRFWILTILSCFLGLFLLFSRIH